MIVHLRALAKRVIAIMELDLVKASREEVAVDLISELLCQAEDVEGLAILCPPALLCIEALLTHGSLAL